MIDINEIASRISERNDDGIARAFTMQIGTLLKENGIIPIATEYTKYDTVDMTNVYSLAMVYEYGVCFEELDTSEHDERVRADERAKVFDNLLSQTDHLYNDVYSFTIDELVKLKEQKNE